MLKKSFLRSRVFLVLVVVIAAFLAAFIGEIVTNNFSGGPSLTPDSFIIRPNASQPKADLQKAADLIDQRESAGFVQYYKGSNKQYLDYLGEGIVLTNDGWTAAVKTDTAPTYLRTSAGDVLKIDQEVDDTATNLAFYHVSSSVLTAVTLADKFGLVRFDDALVSGRANLIDTAQYLGDRVRSEVSLSSGEMNRFPVLDNGQMGERVYNTDGELIGLVSFQDSSSTDAFIVPADYLRQTLDQLLRDKTIVHASLNIRYLDLAQVPVTDTLKGESGAWLSRTLEGQQTIPATLSSAGLRYDDVIVSVNGQLVNLQTTLSDLILKLSPDDKIDLGILRAGKPLTIKVTVGQSSSAS